MPIASNSRSFIDKLKNQLSFEFEIKDLGEVKNILGTEIERDHKSGKFCLRQKGYLKRYFRSSTSTVTQIL